MTHLGQRKTYTHCRHCSEPLTDRNADTKTRTYVGGPAIVRTGLCISCRREADRARRATTPQRKVLLWTTPAKCRTLDDTPTIDPALDWSKKSYPQYEWWRKELFSQVIRSKG